MYSHLNIYQSVLAFQAPKMLHVPIYYKCRLETKHEDLRLETKAKPRFLSHEDPHAWSLTNFRKNYMYMHMLLW